jgi:hypothetical protein
MPDVTSDFPDAASASLLDIYLALSHIGGPSAGPLAPLPGEAPEETPRAHIARLADGHWRVFIRPDLPAAIRDQLAALSPATLFADYARVASILAQGVVSAQTASGLGAGLWIGRTLLFPDSLADDVASAQSAFGNLVRLAPARDGGDPYGGSAPAADRLRPAIAPADEAPPAREVFPGEQFAALADGVVVATCLSARESALAAEAWVRTLPAARGRGHATRVTAAWALDVRRRGKTPFYSHHRENSGSAGVARALRLIPFLDDVGYL